MALRIHPGRQLVDLRPRRALAHRAPDVGRMARDRALDVEQDADAVERLLGNGRLVRGPLVPEAAPRVAPAADLGNTRGPLH